MDFESLARATSRGARSCASPAKRTASLVLPAMRAVRFSTIQKAARVQPRGGLVIALGALPEASDRVGPDDPELDALVEETFGGPNGQYAVQTKEQPRN